MGGRGAHAGVVGEFDDPARGIHGAFPWAFSQLPDPLGWSTIFAGGMTTIAVLLFVGAISKSAQLPLFVWLPVEWAKWVEMRAKRDRAIRAMFGQ